MSWMPRGVALSCCMLFLACAGCANRPRGWGFPWGQGTQEVQASRAAVHDPYPLNDIGPTVLGGRPRGFFDPEAEPVRANVTEPQLPSSFTPPR